MAALRLLALAGLMALAAREATGSPLYSVVDLGPASSDVRTFPKDLNNRGDVVVAGGVYHSYGPDAGKVTTPEGVRIGTRLDPHITAVNDRGDVVGQGIDHGGWNNRPFVAGGGKVVPIPTPDGYRSISAYGINNAGDVLLNGDGRAAFVYRNGELVRLGGDGTFGFPTAISDLGQVTGYASDGASSSYHAALFSDGKVVDLGTLGGPTSRADAINDRGEVVGSSTLAGGGETFHAFVHRDGKMTDLGTLDGAGSSDASGINNAGQIVGVSNGRAVLWESGSIHDLNTLLRDPPPDLLIAALKINDLGQILALGGSSPTHGYLLTPDSLPPPGTPGPVPAVPEPTTILVFGVLALGWSGRLQARPRRGMD